MARLEIDLPEATVEKLNRQMADTCSANASSYINGLIDNHQPLTTELGRKRALMNAYLALIEADLAENGPSTKTIEDVIAEGEARYRARHGETRE